MPKRLLPTLVLLAVLCTLLMGARCRRRRPPPPPPPSGPIVRQLQVSRHVTSVLDNAGADTILADATTVLRTNDGPGDVACDLTLVRNGPVTTFNVPANGIINGGADFNTVIGLPGNVKVVNQINWCGAFAPNIIGCSPVPGVSLAVVRFTANQEGILWTHEFGHNKGLNHRNDPTAVMNGIIDILHNMVNPQECNAYRN